MTQPKKAQPDWERIEAAYRAGVMSLRELATLHGITEGAIRKRAKRDEWPRDLAAKVQAKADELVRKEEVRKQVRDETIAYRESEAVAIGAKLVAEVKLSHKTSLTRMRTLCDTLMGEIEAETNNPGLFQELGEFLRGEDDAAADKRAEVYRRAISSAGRLDGAKKLADMLKVLIPLEREAYGILPTPQQINLNTTPRKADDLTDEELLTIATRSRPGTADPEAGEG